MRVGEVLLVGTLVAIGTVHVQQQRARTRRRLARLLRRESRLRQDVQALRERRRALETEVQALRNDPYLIERTVREELHWHPVYQPVPAPEPSPPGQASPMELAQRVPEAPDSAAPAPQPGRQGQRLLAALGYDSVTHFQRKMMQGRVSGSLDRPTVGRARQLLALLRRAGCTTVEGFQRRHGLAPDGILGQRTERCLHQVLDRLHQDEPETQSGLVIHDGGHSRPPSDG